MKIGAIVVAVFALDCGALVYSRVVKPTAKHEK